MKLSIHFDAPSFPLKDPPTPKANSSWQTEEGIHFTPIFVDANKKTSKKETQDPG